MEHSVSIANKRNQIGKLRTSIELTRLEKAQKFDKRMQENNLRQKFNSSFLKYKISERPSQSNSGVNMYHTHTPGFCYRRNGERKTNTEVEPKNAEVNLKNFEDIVFTDDEVDVDKILCLHLLATHSNQGSSSTLTSNNSNTSDNHPESSQSVDKPTASKHTTKSSMIHRQQGGASNPRTRTNVKCTPKPRNKPEEFRLAKKLPMYVLEFRAEKPDFDVKSLVSTDEEISDAGSLRSSKINNKSKILVNEKIRKLINTVLLGLERANPEKMKLMIEMAQSLGTLREMIRKPNIQKFMYLLNDKLFLLRADFFLLMESQTTPIILRCEPSTNLERLVLDIRENITQTDDSKTGRDWRMQTSNTQVSTISNQNMMERKFSIISKHSTRNYELPYASSKNSKSNMSEHSLASFLSKKFREARHKDMEELKNEKRRAKIIEKEEKGQDCKSAPSMVEPRPEQIAALDAKPFSVRRSSCAACLQKFKLPRALPKGRPIRRVNHDLEPSLVFFKNISNTSTALLTRLLQTAAESQKNKYNVSNMKKYVTHPSWDSISNKDAMVFRNPSVLSDIYSISKYSSPTKIDANQEESIFSEENLEKIQQEVALKETHKRLKKFLDRPSF